MKKKKITLALDADTVRDLKTLSETGDIREVLYRLADHAHQGITRPGSWERQWLQQAFVLPPEGRAS